MEDCHDPRALADRCSIRTHPDVRTNRVAGPVLPRRYTGLCPAFDYRAAEGTWIGSFRLSYRMKLPAPGLQPIPVKSEGDLTYQLTHRGEFSDRKERPRPPLRRPLGAPTPPEAPKPLPEWVDSEPQIRGTAKFSMTAELRYQRQGDRVSGDVASSDRPELRVQEELSDFKDKIVALVGFGDPARFRVGMPFAGRPRPGTASAAR